MSITKKQFTEIKKKIKKYIEELKPNIKNLNNEQKIEMNTLMETLYWSMVSDTSPNIANYMKIEQQQEEDHIQKLIFMAQTHKQVESYIQMAYLKHMLSVLEIHKNLDNDMVIVIVNNLS